MRPAPVIRQPVYSQPEPRMHAGGADTPGGGVGGSYTPGATAAFATPRTVSRNVPASRELFIGGLPLVRRKLLSLFVGSAGAHGLQPKREGAGQEATEDDIRPLFEKHGVIDSLDMSNVSKGFAFLTYVDVESAQRAVEQAGVTLQRRHLNIRYKLPRRR